MDILLIWLYGNKPQQEYHRDESSYFPNDVSEFL